MLLGDVGRETLTVGRARPDAKGADLNLTVLTRRGAWFGDETADRRISRSRGIDVRDGRRITLCGVA